MYVPGSLTVEALVRRIATPQALDEHGGSRNLTIEVFLALLLLHFEREARAQDTLHTHPPPKELVSFQITLYD